MINPNKKSINKIIIDIIHLLCNIFLKLPLNVHSNRTHIQAANTKKFEIEIEIGKLKENKIKQEFLIFNNVLGTNNFLLIYNIIIVLWIF
ncbi:MAG: hypothetical protein CMP51_02655 [Flavobacteriales bacterium]|nr:hypothetical protein [Flavobacteriales bacterium]|tara:strand:- start:1068 stop:1337 length:270 start_codon:yes stop_codon:yes gene_type:complete